MPIFTLTPWFLFGPASRAGSCDRFDRLVEHSEQRGPGSLADREREPPAPHGPAGLGLQVLVPWMRRHGQTALARGAAEGTEPVAEGVARGATALGHGEGDQPPLAVPATPGHVLRVGEAGALDGAPQRRQA